MQNYPTINKRYGTNDVAIEVEASSVLESLLGHKSVRHFRPDTLPPGTLERLIAAGQSAATSSNLQTWSVVAIQDPDRKSEAARLCGDQEFIRRAPLFLVFCADLHRLDSLSKRLGLPALGLDYLEMFLIAVIDASLAAQNIAAAAESEGLGICYVGAARNLPLELAALLELPSRVAAVFGMAIGVPSETDRSQVKPRLPQSVVLHSERYHLEDEALMEYDQTMQRFYEEHQPGVTDKWSRRSAERVASPEALTGRDVLKQRLAELGFELK